MPRKKKTETEPTLAEKIETKIEAVKETAPAEKPAAKTTAKAPAAPKETVKIQFGGDEYDFAEIKKAVKADYKAKFNDKIKTVEIYIKPEDKAAYYVINSEFSDKIEL